MNDAWDWERGRDALVPFIIALNLVGLFFSWTNLIPISAVGAASLVFLPLLLPDNRPYLPVFRALFLMLAYFIMSTLVYAPQSLLHFSFYRWDGNVFVTFPPLLVLFLCQAKLDMPGGWPASCILVRGFYSFYGKSLVYSGPDAAVFYPIGIGPGKF